MTLAEQFRTWALAPERTNDELFTVELLLDQARTIWGIKHKDHETMDWSVRDAHRKQRRLNPAYRPALDPARMDIAVEVWAELTGLNPIFSDDRPVRDLSALRFFPHFRAIAITSELSDLGVVASLRELRKLSLRDKEIEDLRPLAGLPHLEEVSLTLHMPWPDVSSLGTLPALKRFDFSGNVLALREVPALAAVEKADLHAFLHDTPLRDLRDAPAMPGVRELKVRGVAALRGAERFPEVGTLELHGAFADLAPIAALRAVRSLTLQGERFHDLSPVATLPRLRRLVLQRERGIDLTPLADAPMLCDVQANSKVLETELVSLQAIIRISDEEFLARAPRPLPKLRAFIFDSGRPDAKQLTASADARREMRAVADDDDPVWPDAESDWFGRTVDGQMTALLGEGWGTARVGRGHGGHTQVVFWRRADLERCEELAEVLRELSATARFPWECLLCFTPPDPWEQEMHERRNRSPEEEEEVRDARDLEERKAHRRSWREVEELREREHRLRLLEQQGLPINPEEFAPRDEPPPVQDYSDDDGDAEDEDETWSFYVELNENGLWVTPGWEDKGREVLTVSLEDWHALPEPPEQRPRRK